MKLWKLMSVALTVGAMAFGGGAARAAMAPDVLILGATDGSAAPGGTATTTFTIGFNGTYEFIGVGATIEYNPLQMSFNPLASKVSVLGVERSLPDFLGLMAQLENLPGSDFISDAGENPSGTLFFSAGYTILGSMSLNGEVVVTTAFDLLPSFAVGSQSTVALTQLDIADINTGIVTLATPENPVLMTVTAVPEPESWLMLLAGMGLLGAVARRRSPRH